VYSKLQIPSSKEFSFKSMAKCFLQLNFSFDHVYRILDYFYVLKESLLILHLHEMVRMHYERDTINVYYDVTDYYFEINESYDFNKKDVSKKNRTNPII